MPNIEFDIPQTIVSPYLPAGLLINQPLPVAADGNAYFFMVRPAGYKIAPAKFRAVTDSISQADGSSIQPPFIDGLVATMTVEYWVAVAGDTNNMELACGDDVRIMNEMLVGVLNSLRVWTADPNNDQRYLWTPTGLGSQRMLTDVILAAWPEPALDPPNVQQTFSLGTPFPYAIDIAEIDTVITDGSSTAIANAGNASQSPVMRVAGPTSAFTITNTTTGQEIVYDSSRPGAVAIGSGDYAEIDFFQGSIFLNGNGADLVAGLDPLLTDLFTLNPGSQTISITGADVTVLSSPAWL